LLWKGKAFDRGHFAEPHTGRRVGLGTISVREYLGERQGAEAPATIDPGSMADTVGPENRFDSVLFLEKEGFNSLIAHAQICERFDLGLTSSKGMSNTALRMMLDGLIERGMRKVFVLHDFDASGFSIFGTLGTDSRRYTFKNKIEVIDLGLRLSDAREMDLQDEYSPKYWDSRVETLKRHGATYEKISFLEHNEDIDLSKTLLSDTMSARRRHGVGLRDRQLPSADRPLFVDHGSTSIRVAEIDPTHLRNAIYCGRPLVTVRAPRIGYRYPPALHGARVGSAE
jgi:hypothetical protein